MSCEIILGVIGSISVTFPNLVLVMLEPLSDTCRFNMSVPHGFFTTLPLEWWRELKVQHNVYCIIEKPSIVSSVIALPSSIRAASLCICEHCWESCSWPSLTLLHYINWDLYMSELFKLFCWALRKSHTGLSLRLWVSERVLQICILNLLLSTNVMKKIPKTLRHTFLIL